MLSIVLELLNNILIILETLHIKSNDILDLKLYEKLNKIKGYVHKLHSLPLCNVVINNINILLNQWKLTVELAFEVQLHNKIKKANDDYDGASQSPSIKTDADSDNRS